MTSITHAATSPAFGTSPRRIATSSTPGRFRFGADSRAVRVGLGVAIAAVLAGDVYAVLRSPVSEGTASSTLRRGGATGAAPVGEAGASRGGYVATNPFGEAAYGADLASRIVVPATATAARSAGPAVDALAPASPAPAAAPAVPAPMVVAPVAPPAPAPAPTVVVPSVSAPSNAPSDAPAEPTIIPSVVQAIADVPVVGGTVAPVVEQVVEASPVPVAEVEAELAPVTGPVTGSVPSL